MARYLSSTVPNHGILEIVRMQRDEIGVTVTVKIFESSGWVERERFYPWTSVQYIETREA